MQLEQRLCLNNSSARQIAESDIAEEAQEALHDLLIGI